MSCNHITCQIGPEGRDYSRVISGLPPDTDSMIPRPTAITNPITTHTGDTCRRTPPYHSAATAPMSRTKYPIRYMLMNRIDAPWERGRLEDRKTGRKEDGKYFPSSRLPVFSSSY